MPRIVKRSLSLLLALAAVFCLTQPALAAGVTYMPDVTPEMSDAAYWADLQEGSRDVILTMEEIEAFNQDSAIREGTMVMDLRTSPETFNGLVRNDDIRSSAASDANYYLGWTYTGSGEPSTQEYFDPMIENCVDPTAVENMPVRYGIAVDRTLLRVFPSPAPILDDPGDPDFDYQSLSSIRVNEPLIIYTTSADGQYYLARVYSCAGWVPVEDVAICANKEEWLSAWDLPSEQLLVFYGDKEYTDASNSTPQTARRMLTTGTALELAPPLEPGQLVGNRSPYHNYVVYLPVRRDDGSYEKQMALIPETAAVSVGYLPLTMENIAMVALNNLGDAYGWGGMLDVEDCSGLVRVVYSCFGLDIGRNGDWQANMNIEKIDMTNMSLEEKRTILDGMPLGSALCFSGHEMMYLGKVDGKYYVVSTVSSIISPDTGKALRTRDVMINTLDVKRGSGKTWLGALNLVFMPCYAKLEGKSYDFPTLQWYHDAVAYCLSAGVLPGLDIDDTFGVGQGAVRGDLARALWALAGSPMPAEAAPAADGTAAADPAADGTAAADPAAELSPTPEPTPAPDPAVISMDWAAAAGYIPAGGTAQDPLTLQQALDGLWGLAKAQGVASAAGAADALSWAQSAGLLTEANGDPALPVAREGLALLLYRYSGTQAPPPAA